MTGIEVDTNMKNELVKRCPAAESRIIQGDFFALDLRQNYFNIIYIESGLFLFTDLGNQLIFELFGFVTYDMLYNGFLKINNALSPDGKFLIGTQGLMERVSIGENLFFNMKRHQLQSEAIRNIKYTYKRSIFQKEIILHEFTHSKPTMSYGNFLEIAQRTGFKSVRISEDRQWVILSKQ